MTADPLGGDLMGLEEGVEALPEVGVFDLVFAASAFAPAEEFPFGEP